VAVTGTGEGEIDVTWDASPEPDLDHYRLERSVTGDFGPGTDPFDLPEPVFHDSGLTPGETYHYRVIAVDVGGNESDPSNVDSAIALDLPPAAPTGLAAVTGTNEGEIDISWNASAEPDFDRYLLERSTAPDFDPGSEPFEGAVAYFTDTGLYPGDMYYYRVYAIDAGGNVSPPSAFDFANAQDLDPAAPTGLTATTGGEEGEVDLAWEANTELDLDHYRVERDEDPGFPAPFSFTAALNAATDGGLTPGATYHYRVFAVDVAGNESGPSNVDSAVAQNLPPAAPMGLVAVTGTNEGEIDITWDASPEPDIDRYMLERSTAPDFDPGSEPFEGAVTYFTDSGLLPGETYYYRVYAIDVGGNVSPPSESDFADAQDLPPAAPADLVAASGTDEGSIDLVWIANGEPDIDHYRVERDDNPGFSSPDSFTSDVSEAIDGGLVPGDTYHYRVFAVDVAGNESGPSNVDSAVAQDLPPAAPMGLVAGGGIGEGEVDLSWTASPEPDVDRYRIERDTDISFPSPAQFETAQTSYTDTDLMPAQLYFYRVLAIDLNANASAPSIPDSAAATDLPPSAPTGLAAVEGASEGEVQLSWNANPELDIDFYRVGRDTTEVFGPDALWYDVYGTSHLDGGLAPDTYYYCMVAVDYGDNLSALSETVSVTLEQTGIDEQLAAAVSFIRPNPFSAETTIRYAVPAEGAAVSIRLYDIRGRLVRTLADGRRSGGTYDAVWDGRDNAGRAVSSGIYFARVSIGEWGETRKIAYVR
jgi:fibronectin type 3 domain-containing protein